MGILAVYSEESKICYNSDITAYVNDVPIRSYNIDGKTWIVAEDLLQYKFRVNYSETYKLLMIDYVDTDRKEITADYDPQTDVDDIGNVAGEVLKSDISVRMGKNYVEGYNMGGKIIIPFDELKNLGSVDWDPENREIRYTYQALWEQEILSEKDIEEGNIIRRFSLEMKNENDGFIVDGENLNYFECKSVHGNTLNFKSDIRANQWQGLLKKSCISGVNAGIICWFIDHDITIYLPIEDLQYLLQAGNKSFNILKDREKILAVEIIGTKRKIFFDYDLDHFFFFFEYE